MDMPWLPPLLTALAALLLILAGWRALDRRAERAARDRLIALCAESGGCYRAELVASLPEPARRYFSYTIAPGTPLHTVVEIHMSGQLGLGSREAPAYRPMRATQVLAPPLGLVWQLRSGPISGSDAALPDASWTRFWLFGLIPMVRAGGPDHRRSAFGRVVAEAAFWVPASLLPSDRVRWEPLTPDSARAIVRYGGFEQAVDITVDAHGAPQRVLIQRWSNENAERVFRAQPFGGTLADFRDFGGYRLPTRVEGGNHFGTAAYFPFFRATVTALDFPAARTCPGPAP